MVGTKRAGRYVLASLRAKTSICIPRPAHLKRTWPPAADDFNFSRFFLLPDTPPSPLPVNGLRADDCNY